MQQGLGSLSLRRSGLTSAMLPGGSMKDGGASPGGMVPVRTGFAWTTLGMLIDQIGFVFFGTCNFDAYVLGTEAWIGLSLLLSLAIALSFISYRVRTACKLSNEVL